MSNPLLRPGDPRFQRPSITDAEGKNVFADPLAESPGPPHGEEGNLYAAASDSAPYQPRYLASQQSRGALLLTLAILALVGNAVGAICLLVGYPTGWILGIIAIIPAACAWLLGVQDMRAIRMGALDEKARPLTRAGLWLGVLGVLGSLATLALPFLTAGLFSSVFG